MKRAKFYLPRQFMFTSHRPEAYTSQMLYVGATVDFNGFSFQITDADEFTLKYMESHESEYPMANISSIMSKIKGAILPIYKDFIGKYLGKVPLPEKSSEPEAIKLCYFTTAMALRELLGDQIMEHEIVTFLRYFNADKSPKKSQAYDRMTIQSMVQTAIANRLWDDIQGLKERIYEQDPANHNGFMRRDKLCSIIKGCRIPIKSILIDDMFAV